MRRFIIRHGFTGVKRDQRDAFGVEGPPLDELGQKQAKKLKQALIHLGVDPSTESVAISEFLRTRQTAELAGFTNIQVRPVLNEVQTGLPGDELKAMLAEKHLPPAVLERAQAALDNPPKEAVWISHGLLIMGLCELFGIKNDPFELEFCSITEINI